MLFLQGRFNNRRAPRPTERCPDCGHDVRKQHHTPAGGKTIGYRPGYCIKCKVICPSILKRCIDYENE